MGLRIFELCLHRIMCFSYIRHEEKDGILPMKLSLPILYLTEAKKQIIGVYEGCQGIYW
jgi:hypothetical protein